MVSVEMTIYSEIKCKYFGIFDNNVRIRTFSFRAKTTCKCAILFHPFDVAVFAVSKILVRVTTPGIVWVVLAPKRSPSTTIQLVDLEKVRFIHSLVLS